MIPSIAQDQVTLVDPVSGNQRTVVFDRGSTVSFVEGRAVILETVVVSADGTILRALNTSGKTSVTIIEQLPVLYVGAEVVDQFGWIGPIVRTSEPSVSIRWE